MHPGRHHSGRNLILDRSRRNAALSTAMGPWYRLVLGALAVWRVTHLLYAEEGPFDVLVWLRRMGGRLFACFYCLSVWVAAPFALLLGESWRERLLLVPALSAAAIVIERLSERAEAPPAAFYEEDEEAPDGVLRKETGDSGEDGGAA
jgi:hypothetical protein